MTATSVSELLDCVDELSLTTEKGGSGRTGLTVYPLKLSGRSLHLKLAEDLESVSVAFEPTGYSTLGTRKTLTLNVNQRVFDAFAAMEEACRQELATLEPDVNALWHSSIRPQQAFSATLRVKINTSSPRAAHFYDSSSAPAAPPSTWPGLPVNAVVHVKGCYVQRLPNGAASAYGLMLEVTHLVYGANPAEICPF